MSDQVPASTQAPFEDFTRQVIPELQRRGLFRTEYEGATLRQNLGLCVPRTATPWTAAADALAEPTRRGAAPTSRSDAPPPPSSLDRLRDGPYLRSGAELSRAVSRLDEVRGLASGLPGTAHVPPGRVAALARFAAVAKAQAVARLPKERRAATLLAFVRTLEASAQDDVLDLFDIWSRPCSPTPPRSASAPGCGPSATLTPQPSSSVKPAAR